MKFHVSISDYQHFENVYSLNILFSNSKMRNQENLEEANDIEKLLDTLGASELLVCEIKVAYKKLEGFPLSLFVLHAMHWCTMWLCWLPARMARLSCLLMLAATQVRVTVMYDDPHRKHRWPTWFLSRRIYILLLVPCCMKFVELRWWWDYASLVNTHCTVSTCRVQQYFITTFLEVD